MLNTRRLCVLIAVLAALAIPCSAEKVLRVLGGGEAGWAGWTTVGAAWHSPTNSRGGNPFPNLPHWESMAVGEAGVGTLRSPDFTVRGDTVRLTVAGWEGGESGSGSNEFVLKSAETGAVLRRVLPPLCDALVPRLMLASELKGKRVYIECADVSSDEKYSWLALALVEEVAKEVPGARSPYRALNLPAGLGTWMIRRHDGATWETTAHLSSLGNGETGTGIARSRDFTVSVPTIKLAIRGYDGPGAGGRGLNRVELVDSATGKVLRTAVPPQAESPKETAWDVADLAGRKVFVRLVDRNSDGSGAWLGLDTFDAGKDFTVKFAENPSTDAWTGIAADPAYTEYEGLPFLARAGSPLTPDSRFSVGVGCAARRILLLGMTNSIDQGNTVWCDPRLTHNRWWVGDTLGEIRVRFADGSVDTYPLTLGESLWWGKKFYDFQEPFASDPKAKQVLADAVNLYPPQPVVDGRYVAFIEPRAGKIASIEVVDGRQKDGAPVVLGMTLELRPGDIAPADMPVLPYGGLSDGVARFVAAKPLRKAGSDEAAARKRREALIHTLYQTPNDLANGVKPDMPADYRGPIVCFKGDVYADVLTNMFHYNVKDIADKITPDGMYHTSTENAPTWGTYEGFGTYKKNFSTYYGHSWSRDLGRSLQEISELGLLDKAAIVADYCLRMNNLWEEKAAELSQDGHSFPAHTARIMNTPSLTYGNFENDGHGLVTLFVYKFWQRVPDRDQWLKDRWKDIRKLGEWVVWQLDNPALSGAKNGVLRTESECSSYEGFSVYADAACMEGLYALVDMASSIGETADAARWRRAADTLRKGIADNYVVDEPKYGKAWTLKYAGWPNKSTVLGPRIYLADRRGFTPEDDDLGWRAFDQATYQRMIDSYKPLGYYGVAMGYGQGFVTQSALLLDRMGDASKMLEWAAKCIYSKEYMPYIVPEGCELHPSGKFWRRSGDLGNGVQEGEIVKVMRLVIGIDDNNPARLQIAPRMPTHWTEIRVSKYPALVETDGKREMAELAYTLKRTPKGLSLQLTSGRPLPELTIRLGAFTRRPDARVLLNGRPVDAAVTRSGDSWWQRVAVPAGADKITIEPH